VGKILFTSNQRVRTSVSSGEENRKKLGWLSRKIKYVAITAREGYTKFGKGRGRHQQAEGTDREITNDMRGKPLVGM